MSIGFVHGVLNTDNLSLAGTTIDYGPFAFMEYFDLDFVPNTTDEEGVDDTKGVAPQAHLTFVALSLSRSLFIW